MDRRHLRVPHRQREQPHDHGDGTGPPYGRAAGDGGRRRARPGPPGGLEDDPNETRESDTMTTTTDTSTLERTTFFIGGEWTEPAGQDTIEVLDPTTEQAIGHVPE